MRLGRAGGRYPPDSTPAQRKLADHLTLLCQCMERRTQAERASQIWVSKPALSHYVNARRIPSVATLQLMYTLAAEGGRASLPCNLAELLRLRELARSRSCGTCGQIHAASVS